MIRNMIARENLKEMLECMERLIGYSLSNGLNLHTPVGGKYGEIFVASELWNHDPKLASHRSSVEGIQNPNSCDVVLGSTKKKLEVKLAMLHQDDHYSEKCGGVPYWGWGFSNGEQFKDRKFDYCILLAAEKGGAKPVHIFVLKLDEM